MALLTRKKIISASTATPAIIPPISGQLVGFSGGGGGSGAVGFGVVASVSGASGSGDGVGDADVGAVKEGAGGAREVIPSLTTNEPLSDAISTA